MLEKLHSVYAWKAYHINGSVTHGGELNSSDLIKFELIPQAPNLPEVSVNLTGSRELIFFKTIFCRSDIGAYRIEFHVGYKEDGKENVKIIGVKVDDTDSLA